MAIGSCLCGGVAFEVSGTLTEIEYCHCPKCKKVYGSAFAATLYVRSSDFTWLRGEGLVGTYEAPLKQAPPPYRHSFCRKCGAPLPLVWERAPFVEVPAATLNGAVESRPAYHQFARYRAPWFDSIDSLPKYDGAAPLEEKVIHVLV